jgi:hypothetical protein
MFIATLFTLAHQSINQEMDKQDEAHPQTQWHFIWS